MTEVNVSFDNLQEGKIYLVKKKDEDVYHIIQLMNKQPEKMGTVNVIMTRRSANNLDWEENEKETITSMNLNDFDILYGFPESDFDMIFETIKQPRVVINKEKINKILRTKAENNEIPSLSYLSTVALPTQDIPLSKELVLPKTKKGGRKSKKAQKRKSKKRKSKKHT
jgi:hypothetical protein